MANTIRTRALTRNKIASFLKDPELVKAFEDLTVDVSATIPAIIAANGADITAAAAAAAAAQTTANSASAAAAAAQTSANTAQTDANALKAVPYVTIGASATVSNERSLAVAASLKLTDGGAGNPVTLAIADLEAIIAPTLLNSWVNFGAPYNPAGYYKDPQGIVHLRGMVKSGVIGSAMFNLPAGYRPANQEIFTVTSNNAYGRVDANPGGDITCAVGSNAFVSLDGITFRPA